MRPASDYLTLLQLAVGLNLVVGAYSSYRQDTEDKIQQELDFYRGRMDEILEEESTIKLTSHDLQLRPIKELSNRELSRYLGDTSIRFHRRSNRFRRRDGIEPWLLPNGILMLFLLLYASLWPKTLISYNYVYPICALAITPALWCYIRQVLETGQHLYYFRRPDSEDYQKKSEVDHNARMRSGPLKGEVSRATNAVRVRYKAFQSGHKKIRPIIAEQPVQVSTNKPQMDKPNLSGLP